MRRLAYAVAFLLVIGLAAAGVFTRSHPPDGRALLISAAEAMQTAQTLHVFFTGVSSIEEMLPMPGEGEMWLSDRAAVLRYLNPDGGLRMYVQLDTDQQVWRTYDADKNTLYEAALGPAADRVPEILSAFSHMLRTGQVTALELSDHPEAEVTTKRDRRDGKALDVVTFRYALPPPSEVLVRREFDLEAKTHRLIAVRRYVWTEGTAEKLLDSIREISYDGPMPRDLSVPPRLPGNAEIVVADVSVEETDKSLSLVMMVNGKDVGRCDVPKTE